MGEKAKIRKPRKWLALSLTAALMALALPWPADTALASGILGGAEAGNVKDSLEGGEPEIAEGPEVLEVPGPEAEGAEQEATTEEQEDTNIASGIDGDIKWVIDANGKLTISGSGDFSSSPSNNSNLWNDYQKSVKSAEVNVTGMTSAAELFMGLSNLTSVDISGLDTKNITTMEYMFNNCSSLASLDLSGFDTSNVTTMEEMFAGCNSLTSLKLSSFNTSNVTSMYRMFYDCSSLPVLDLASFDTGNVKSMDLMFSRCRKLTDLKLSSFNTANVTGMRRMFEYCGSLTSLDLGKFDMGKAADVESMLLGCDKLETINAPLNLTQSVAIPAAANTVWRQPDGTEITELPKNLTQSIELCRESDIMVEAPTCEITDFVGGKEVTFKSATKEAVIYYSDKADITDKDKKVENGGKVRFESFNGTLYARAYANGQWSKDIFNMTLNIPRVEMPIISSSENRVEISAPASDSTIYYTTDGSIPTIEEGINGNGATVYLDNFVGTLNAIAVKNGHSNSAMATYIVKAAAPTFNEEDCLGGKEISFTSATKNAIIYYSTTSSNITTEDKWVQNGGKVVLEGFNGTIYARAYRNGQWSAMASYTVSTSQADMPTITTKEDKVIIQSPMEGSMIYYTTDGSVPTLTNGNKAEGASVTIDTLSGAVKAIAVKSGYANSAMARKVLLNSNKNRTVSFAVKGAFGGRNVTFDTQTKGAKIYYSATTSTLTTKDKCVNAGETVLFENFYGTIYARTYYNGEWGNPCRLILKIPVVNTPTISVDSKGYAIIKTTTPKSRIYYTTDGSTPSMTNGKMVSSPYVRVYVGKGKTVKAIAVRSCFTHSKVATGE